MTATQIEDIRRQIDELDREIAERREKKSALVAEVKRLRSEMSSLRSAKPRSASPATQATRDAVVRLLERAGGAMPCNDAMVRNLALIGYHDHLDRSNPASTVARRIRGDERILRTEAGYSLKEWGDTPPSAVGRWASGPPRGLFPLDAVEYVLRFAGAPLHYLTITRRMIDAGLWSPGRSQKPEKTVRGRLSDHISEQGNRSVFIRIRRGIFALRGRDGADA